MSGFDQLAKDPGINGLTNARVDQGSNVRGQWIPKPNPTSIRVSHDAEQSVPVVQQRIPEGLMAAFHVISRRWKLPASDLNVFLGYSSDSSMGGWLVAGLVTPETQDVADRIGYLAAISGGLGAMFNEDPESEVKWLNAPHVDLSGQTPLDQMREGHIYNLIAVSSIVAREQGL